MEYTDMSDDEFTDFLSQAGEALMMYYSHKSIGYEIFMKLSDIIPLDFQEWSHSLHLSERTLQRYKKGKKELCPDLC